MKTLDLITSREKICPELEQCNFQWYEVFKSPTADRYKITNIPTENDFVKTKLTEEQIINNLKNVVTKIAQPARNYFNKPLVINSGYRNLLTNKKVGGSSNSQHMRGEALDIEIPGVSNYELANWIADNCEFDQVILEFYTPGNPSSGWVHASLRESGNRKNKLTINRNGTFSGFLK
jgi:hypothetical protein